MSNIENQDVKAVENEITDAVVAWKKTLDFVAYLVFLESDGWREYALTAAFVDGWEECKKFYKIEK